MKYNKLVRDRIPEIIKQKGETPVTHIANDEEYWKKLKEKLREEANEFSANEKDEELADILEVIHAVCDFKRIDFKSLEKIRAKKNSERGGFKARIILDEAL